MSEWQDISTAPKDRRFLGFRVASNLAMDNYHITVCKFWKGKNEKWYIYGEDDGEGWSNDWTHWMPLPDPPETA